MKNKLIKCLMIELLGAIILTGCNSNHELENSKKADSSDQIATVSSEERNEEETESTNTVSEADLPSNGKDVAADWQVAYANYVKEVQEADALIENSAEKSDIYFLYDIDKNEIPELMIRYGDCEAAYHTVIFSYNEGKIVEVGDLGSGHMSLFSWPEENGIMLFQAHMGIEYVAKGTIDNGKFRTEVLLEKECLDVEYDKAEDIKVGASYIDSYRTLITLPIYQYGMLSAQFVENHNNENTKSADNSQARQAFADVMNNKIKFEGLTTDGFGGEMGLTTLEEACKPGKIREYTTQDGVIKGFTAVDLNADGQYEIILKILLDQEGVFDTYEILSYQDGQVYGYCMNYCSEYKVLQNGVFQTEMEDYINQLGVSFSGEESYKYSLGDEKRYQNSEVEWHEYNEENISQFVEN